MGGIHPRSKKPLGDRLGTAAYNTVYGGMKAYTGPTLASCTLAGGDGTNTATAGTTASGGGGSSGRGGGASLIIEFSGAAQLSGDSPLQLKEIKPATLLTGPSSPTTLSICAALALLTPLVNPGSLYRGGKGT